MRGLRRSSFNLLSDNTFCSPDAGPVPGWWQPTTTIDENRPYVWSQGPRHALLVSGWYGITDVITCSAKCCGRWVLLMAWRRLWRSGMIPSIPHSMCRHCRRIYRQTGAPNGWLPLSIGFTSGGQTFPKKTCSKKVWVVADPWTASIPDTWLHSGLQFSPIRPCGSCRKEEPSNFDDVYSDRCCSHGRARIHGLQWHADSSGYEITQDVAENTKNHPRRANRKQDYYWKS